MMRAQITQINHGMHDLRGSPQIGAQSDRSVQFPERLGIRVQGKHSGKRIERERLDGRPHGHRSAFAPVMPHAYLVGHLHPFVHVAQQIVAQQFAAFAAHALIGFGIHIRVGIAV